MAPTGGRLFPGWDHSARRLLGRFCFRFIRHSAGPDVCCTSEPCTPTPYAGRVMASIVLDRSEQVAEWVSRFSGKPFHRPYDTIGIVNSAGEFTGGFVFTGYNGDSVEVSVAGRGCASRSAWRAVLSYVFEQLHCSRLQAHTRMSNKRNRVIISQMGMKYEGIARRFYGKDHGVLFSLTVDDLPAFRARWRL